MSVSIFPITPFKLPIHNFWLIYFTVILHLGLRFDILIGLTLEFKLILLDASWSLNIGSNVALPALTQVFVVITRV